MVVSFMISGLALHFGLREFSARLGYREHTVVFLLFSFLWAVFGHATFVR